VLPVSSEFRVVSTHGVTDGWTCDEAAPAPRETRMVEQMGSAGEPVDVPEQERVLRKVSVP
jgi:hypothetical protein